MSFETLVGQNNTQDVGGSFQSWVRGGWEPPPVRPSVGGLSIQTRRYMGHGKNPLPQENIKRLHYFFLLQSLKLCKNTGWRKLAEAPRKVLAEAKENRSKTTVRGSSRKLRGSNSRKQFCVVYEGPELKISISKKNWPVGAFSAEAPRKQKSQPMTHPGPGK